MSDSKSIGEIEKRVYTAFAGVAGSIGYSPLHGKIIGALLVGGRVMSLQELAKKTGYSTSMISLSLDLLELLGVIRKVKKTADRKLYIELNSNLLGCLKNILLTRITKNIDDSLDQFERDRKDLERFSGGNKKDVVKGIEILEKEIRRLKHYMRMLSDISLP